MLSTGVLQMHNPAEHDPTLWGLDFERIRSGFYSDPPYLNLAAILSAQNSKGEGQADSGNNLGFSLGSRNITVESHWIVRRKPFAVIAGIPMALSVLRECTGYFDDDGRFVNTYHDLNVRAVDDGEVVSYSGDPLEAVPVVILQGRYREFALLKTPVLGILARASRVATNVYRMLDAARGKGIYTFCARYDPPEVQKIDGYAYHIGVCRYNRDHGTMLADRVSTCANGAWWGGEIEGTISHDAIACFGGDIAELMLRFAQTLPPERIRVALVDFHNDCVADTRRVMAAMFNRYRVLTDDGAIDEANRYKLYGIRLDTSGELCDQSLVASGHGSERGVTPRLVRLVREVIDSEWQRWALPDRWKDRADRWCKDVKIMVSGGLSEERIREFENQATPVDCYGVGSALLSNGGSALTDFASLVMRVHVGEKWREMAKVGRKPNDNPRLKQVQV